MSLFTLGDILKGLIPTAALQNDALEVCREEPTYTNNAAITTTTTLPELPVFIARRKMRIMGARFTPATAVTGAATNYFSIVIAVRHIAAPATQKIVLTYNADTAVTKDVAAFSSRDMWAAGDVNAAAADADFILLAGDVLTLTVTKAGTGMTFPISTIDFITEMRD
jgi:hypothetical protein